MDIKEVFKSNWKMILAGVLGLLLLLAAFGGGRKTAPDRIVEKEKVVFKENVVYKDKIVEKVVEKEKKVYVKDKSVGSDLDKKVHEEITVTVKPDGSKETKTIRDIDTRKIVQVVEKTVEKVLDVRYVDKIVEKQVEKVVTRDVIKEVTITASKPQWRIGPTVGIDIMTILGQRVQPIPQLGPAVIGVTAERRILGPVFLGVYGNTSGQVGLSVNAEF